MKIIAALSVPVLALGIGALVASPASAHTPDISASCDGVHVGATAYDAGLANRWSVTIGGVTQTGTFGSSFDQTFPVPQGGATTAWSAYVEAADGSYHGAGSGSVGPCGAPPDVQRTEPGALDGCDVALDGTTYGAGALTYDQQFTDTYVLNPATNTYDLVTDTTPTIANVVFTPWTVAQQVANGCVDKAPKPQPGAKQTRHESTVLDCDDDVQVTTVVETTTPYVYDADTNTWVLGKTVEHTTKSSQPAAPGSCTGTSATHTATGTSAHASGGSSAVVTSAGSSSGVPTAADAGLTGASPVAASTSATSSHDARVPALVALLAGLLLMGGAHRLRRS